MRNSIKAVTLFSVLILLGAGCGERWIGFYYPDRSDLSVSRRSQELSSLEECRSWVDDQRSLRRDEETQDDYECGRRCRYDKDWDGYICKETVR